MMDNHPKICGPSPIHLLRFFAPLEHLYGDLSDNSNWFRLIDDVKEMFDLKISHWETELNINELRELEIRSISSMFNSIYKSESAENGKSIVFLKENHAYRLMPYYLTNFPKCKFLWMVRDPRDMALSWKKDNILRGEVVRATSVWKEDQKQSKFIYNTLKPQNLVFHLRYEQLILDSKKWLNDICTFMGLSYNSQMLEYMNQKNTQKHAASSPAWQNLSKEVMKDNSRKFLKGLSEDEIRYIEYVCWDDMISIGYEPEFKKVDRQTFFQLQERLSAEEKYTKDTYLKIDKEEREKRAKWSKWIKSIRETLE
jgi:hypothetical protein